MAHPAGPSGQPPQRAPCSLAELPMNVLSLVLRRLPLQDVVAVERTCSTLRRMVLELVEASGSIGPSSLPGVLLVLWREPRRAVTSVAFGGQITRQWCEWLMEWAGPFYGLSILAGGASHDEESSRATQLLLEKCDVLQHLHLDDTVRLTDGVCAALRLCLPRLQSLSFSVDSEEIPRLVRGTPNKGVLERMRLELAGGAEVALRQLLKWCGATVRELRVERSECAKWRDGKLRPISLRVLAELLTWGSPVHSLAARGPWRGTPGDIGRLAKTLHHLDIAHVAGEIGELLVADCPRLRSFRLACGLSRGGAAGGGKKGKAGEEDEEDEADDGGGGGGGKAAPKGLALLRAHFRNCPLLERISIRHGREGTEGSLLPLELEACGSLRELRVEGCPLALERAAGAPRLERLVATGGLDWRVSAGLRHATGLACLDVGPGPVEAEEEEGGWWTALGRSWNLAPTLLPKPAYTCPWVESAAAAAGGWIGGPGAAQLRGVHLRRLLFEEASLLLDVPAAAHVSLERLRFASPARRRPVSVLTVACPRAESLRLRDLGPYSLQVAPSECLAVLELSELPGATQALVGPLLEAARFSLRSLTLRGLPLAELRLHRQRALQRLELARCPALRAVTLPPPPRPPPRLLADWESLPSLAPAAVAPPPGR
eukprot:tig00021350_g20631.t1